MTVDQSPEPFTFEAGGMAPYVLTAEDLEQCLDVSVPVGLSDAQVKQRREQWGPNRLPEIPPRSAWLLFLGQFKSILILILFGAACLAALIGDMKDALAILAVVVINAVVGFYQEYRAEQSLAALKGMLPFRTRVRRDGQKCEIATEELVPGDVVLLEAGNQVAADGRLVVAAGVEIDESALTGESQPVRKQVAALSTPNVPLADRVNMVYMNTLLTRGRAEIIVTATGMRTEMGQLSRELASATEAPTPLQVQLDQLGKRLGIIGVTLVGLLSFLELLRGTGLAHITLDAIALAVAAVPDGLPVVVTVTLALGMQSMARQRAIVKRLASVETLGCTTVICSDKTGTLTLNEMTARVFFFQGERYNVSGQGYSAVGAICADRETSRCPDFTPLLVPLVACNDSRVDDGRAIGDPMEAALLVLAEKGAFKPATISQSLPRIAEIPFDPAHKFMATFHRENGHVKVFVKGAPDVLLQRCALQFDESGERLLDAHERDRIDAQYVGLAAQGLRGLLVAARTIPGEAFDPAADLHPWIDELTFVGLLGLMDPPRAEVKAAIEQCKQAGIAIKMITGDHQHTAAAIAGELGLAGKAITGAEIERMDAAQFAAAIDDIVIFARVTPAHKVKIVRALQAAGHVVAMTGDGVNDAPALKSADIGVAMGGTGTAVAKAAASVVLTDDNFATLVSAVWRGRMLYDNILKFVRFQLSTTVGAILTVFFAPFAGLPEVFTPIQILWIAIIMDGPPAVSLSLDAARPGIMFDPPRSRAEPVLPLSRIVKIVAYGLTMMVGTLAVLHYGLLAGTQRQALTMAFTTFVLFQFFNVFNSRNEIGTAFNGRLLDNRVLWASLAGVVVCQVIAVHWPRVQLIFETEAMPPSHWGIAVGVAASVLLLEEGRKVLIRLLAPRGWSIAGTRS